MLYMSFLSSMAKEKGAGLAEYALLLALIAVVVIASLGPLGDAIAAVFDFITGELGVV